MPNLEEEEAFAALPPQATSPDPTAKDDVLAEQNRTLKQKLRHTLPHSHGDKHLRAGAGERKG